LQSYNRIQSGPVLSRCGAQ